MPSFFTTTNVSYERIGFVHIFFETRDIFFTPGHKMWAIFVTFDEKWDFLTALSLPVLVVMVMVVYTVLGHPMGNKLFVINKIIVSPSS